MAEHLFYDGDDEPDNPPEPTEQDETEASHIQRVQAELSEIDAAMAKGKEAIGSIQADLRRLGDRRTYLLGPQQQGEQGAAGATDGLLEQWIGNIDQRLHDLETTVSALEKKIIIHSHGTGQPQQWVRARGGA